MNGDEDNTVVRKHWLMRVIGVTLRIILPLAVLAGGVAAAVVFVRTAPKAETRPLVREAQLVDVTTVRKSNHRVKVKAMGTVVPSQRITLQPRVSGELVDISEAFVPGGRFKAGQTVVKVDPEDYQLVVKQRSADLVKAQRDLKIEQGRQVIARREFELLGGSQPSEGIDRDLMLRKPQLEMATAAVNAAQAALDKAELDLKRTTIKAPFNAVIIDKQQVDLGSQVSPNTQIATIAGTDEFWVLVSIPVKQLESIHIPSEPGAKGSPVRIFNEAGWGRSATRTGHVIGLLSMLETEGRMARILVSVDDPLCLKPSGSDLPKLLLGTYVSVVIDGVELTDVIRIRRTSLRDNNTVWVFGPKSELQIREVKVRWRDRDEVYVHDGLRDGDRIVTSDLAVYVSGSPLKINAPTTRPTTRPETRPNDR